MTPFFADTFYFIALLSPDDEAHHAASDMAKLSHPLVTTAWILTELADGLAESPARHLFATFVERLRSNPSVTILPATEDYFNRAMRLYDQRPDKEWSLTDCSSFIVMSDLGLTDALTADHHFEQAGFRIVLGR